MDATMTQARLEVATALHEAGLIAFAHAPATILPPCVVVEPEAPWLIPGIGERFAGRMRLKVTAYAVAIDNAAALSSLENLVERTVKAIPRGVAIESVGVPSEADTGAQGSSLAASILITAAIKENP
jgi:hypothetical protein